MLAAPGVLPESRAVAHSLNAFNCCADLAPDGDGLAEEGEGQGFPATPKVGSLLPPGLTAGAHPTDAWALPAARTSCCSIENRCSSSTDAVPLLSPPPALRLPVLSPAPVPRPFPGPGSAWFVQGTARPELWRRSAASHARPGRPVPPEAEGAPQEKLWEGVVLCGGSEKEGRLCDGLLWGAGEKGPGGRGLVLGRQDLTMASKSWPDASEQATGPRSEAGLGVPPTRPPLVSFPGGMVVVPRGSATWGA